MLKKIIIICLVVFFVNINFGLASGVQDKFKHSLDLTANQTGYNTEVLKQPIEVVIAKFIKAFLGVLGVLFLLLTIYAGHRYMLARGNEQEVDEAKKILEHAIIGLIIVLSAYAISSLVIHNMILVVSNNNMIIISNKIC